MASKDIERRESRPFCKLSTQIIEHIAATARISENVRSGVFATAAMVLQTQHDFIIDFMSTIVRPQQLVARVIMNQVTFAQFCRSMQTDVDDYQRQFGPLKIRARIASQPMTCGQHPVSPSEQAESDFLTSASNPEALAMAAKTDGRSQSPNLAGLY